MSLSRQAARALEMGRWDGFFSRAIASALAPVAARGLVRPAVVPSAIALVCVGGATLGGSGKTRVAIACARELARRGARVVLVGHAYRAAPRASRLVSVDDALDDVGDEALVCARALASSNVPVVIGPTRQAAIDHASSLPLCPEILVLDGPLRIRDQRDAGILSLLAVDANRPWGSGRLPPAGDLRASREVLLAYADHVVPVDATPTRVRWPGGETTPLTPLRNMSVGLFTAIARPDRLVRSLATLGIRVHELVSVPDHGARSSNVAPLDAVRVDTWLATEKCALHLAGRRDLKTPLAILEDDLALPLDLTNVLAGLLAKGSTPKLSSPMNARTCATALHDAP